MTYLEIYKACVDQFLDNWTETQIELEGTQIKVNDLNEFSRVQVFSDDSSNFSHGDEPRKLLIGSVVIEVYIRRGQGVGRLLELTDIAVAIFSNLKLANGIKFECPEVIDRAQMIAGETVTDPNWLSKSIVATYRAPL